MFAMAIYDATYHTQLLAARTAIMTQVAAGTLTVRYKIGSKEHQMSDPVSALRFINDEISRMEAASSSNGKSRFRLAKINRARNADD